MCVGRRIWGARRLTAWMLRASQMTESGCHDVRRMSVFIAIASPPTGGTAPGVASEEATLRAEKRDEAAE